MATKVLLNRMSPLTEKSLNSPHHGYHLLRLSASAMNMSSRKRTASNAFSAAEPTLNKKRRIITTTATPPPMFHKKPQQKTILLLTPQKKTTTKKSVRFDLQQNQTSSSSVYLPNPSLWYSADEMNQIRKREAKVVRSLQQQQEQPEQDSESSSSYHYLHQLTCLLGVACGAYSPSTTTTSIQKAQFRVSNCDEGRGLEKELLGCIRHRRKQVVQTLLQNQLLLQQRGGTYNRPEFREKVLSLQYIKLSTPSAKLAQLMAQGDAMVVEQARAQEQS